ncbi:DUF4190 domain-containing protein [Nocardioides yefusunii]|uniref:DUF4190 domain-containing protein n=1 Tax=Nocardioides yefusunii TaxID=2500546 RepID=A0ABW1QZA0_9ACTN|nr:DUF4190 domain-containing protein [Nocardioides yefusunii]
MSQTQFPPAQFPDGQHPGGQYPGGQPSPYPFTPPQPSGSNGLATAGFVLSLLGILMSWIPLLNIFGVMLAVLGLILAGVGLAKSKKVNAGKGLAIAGLVLGVLTIVITIAINTVFVTALEDAIDETTSTEVVDKDGKSASKDVGTTRDNPAPLGSQVKGDDWTVVINSVSTVEKDAFDQKADSGKVLIAVNLTATYTGDDDQGESAWATVKYVGKDGKTVDGTDGIFVAEDAFDSLETVYSDGSVTGDKILEVPARWESGALAVSPGMFSDDTFVAVK